MSDVDEAFVAKPRRRASTGGGRRPPGSPTRLDLHLGGRLRVLRIARGLSREEMASLVGLTVRDLREQELGVRRIPAQQLVEYAELLEVRLSRFFADPGPRPLPSPTSDP
jgi:DNA-binding XRE family transcriptional regulator